MTGAPIYLVSACASGEEFVAAFRRYADKNGLFVPIREPLPVGSRCRFAVTLKDGGVMIEGEAEIISSARTASVLHGRAGMTLRFLEPDDASKIMLGELEKARLSMRPAPPSVSPRPAEIPAEPRPVPPPVQGRIDAVNALAECVAIGDTSALGPAAAASPIAAPPKAGPKFVMPAVPATPAVPPALGLGVAARAATPPSSTPRATPQPEQPRKDHERRSDPAQAVATISGFSQTMTAVTPLLDPGPISETLTAAPPPQPPAATPPEPAAAIPSEPPAAIPPSAFAKTLVGPHAAPPIAARPTAASPTAATPSVATPSVATPSVASPTVPRRAVEMQAVIPPPITKPHAASVPDACALDGAAPDASAPEVPAPAALAPPRSSPAEIARDGITSDTMTAVPIPGTMPPSGPTDIGGVLVDPLPPIEIVESTSSRDDASARTQVHAGTPLREPPASSPLASADEDLDPVHVSTHIGMPPIPRAATPASPLPAVLTPAPPIVAPPHPAVPEIEIAEPTDLSPGPPEPPVEQPTPLELASTVPEMPILRPRKTVLGVVVAPSGVNAMPGTEATTAPDRDAGNTGGIVDVPPEPARPATPAGAPAAAAGPITPTGVLAAVAGPVTPAGVPAVPAGLPSGDWAIALDPQAPDGWSEPFALSLPEQVAGDPSPVPPPVPPPAAVANAQPRDPVPKRPTPRPAELSGAEPKRPTPRPDELPVAEPKVQIDPTLIEPLKPVSSDPPLRPMLAGASPGPMSADGLFRDAAAPVPGMPGYGALPDAVAAAALPMNVMTPVPPPIPSSIPFLGPHGQPVMHAGQVPDYPMDPSYQMVPMAGLPVPETLSAGGSGLGTPGYASDAALPSQRGRHHAIIILVSALVAVVLGIVVLVVLRSRHAAGTPAGMDIDKPRLPPVAAPNAPATPAPAPAAPKVPAESSAAAPGGAAAAHASDVVAGAPPEAGTCFAEVSSVPPGAEIVIDQTNVIGTTPQKITLPCGAQVELVIRKARLVPVIRTITPTSDGVKLKVALAKSLFLVKVSSTPAGATITMNGKSLGVTPTTVKIPAFELSTLTIAKDGFATETEKVTPRSNGVAVHTTLTKLERKKPR